MSEVKPGKPVLVLVYGCEICDDFPMTVHEITGGRDAKVVLWRGRYYFAREDFVEEYVDYHWEGVRGMDELTSKALLLWEEHAIECLLYHSKAALVKGCEVPE